MFYFVYQEIKAEYLSSHIYLFISKSQTQNVLRKKLELNSKY